MDCGGGGRGIGGGCGNRKPIMALAKQTRRTGNKPVELEPEFTHTLGFVGSPSVRWPQGFQKSGFRDAAFVRPAIATATAWSRRCLATWPKSGPCSARRSSCRR